MAELVSAPERTVLNDVWDSTNHILKTGVNSNGQASAANSAPVVHATDELPQFATWAKAAKAFIASSPNPVTNTNTNVIVCPLSVFNPSNSTKTVLIYSIQFGGQGSSATSSIRLTTTDPSGGTGFTGTVTPTNASIGGAASVASVCYSATTISSSITPTGTFLAGVATASNAINEALTNGAVIILPAGAANGVELTQVVGTAGNSFTATMKWIEY